MDRQPLGVGHRLQAGDAVRTMRELALFFGAFWLPLMGALVLVKHARPGDWVFVGALVGVATINLWRALR